MTEYEFSDMLQSLGLSARSYELLMRCFLCENPTGFWQNVAHKEILKVRNYDDLLWFTHNYGEFVMRLGRKHRNEIIKKCEEVYGK